MIALLVASVVIAYSNRHARAVGPELVDPNVAVRTAASGLTMPVSLAFLGSDNMLVREKSTGRTLENGYLFRFNLTGKSAQDRCRRSGHRGPRGAQLRQVRHHREREPAARTQLRRDDGYPDPNGNLFTTSLLEGVIYEVFRAK
jgi:hypothetical protein